MRTLGLCARQHLHLSFRFDIIALHSTTWDWRSGEEGMWQFLLLSSYRTSWRPSPAARARPTCSPPLRNWAAHVTRSHARSKHVSTQPAFPLTTDSSCLGWFVCLTVCRWKPEILTNTGTQLMTGMMMKVKLMTWVRHLCYWWCVRRVWKLRYGCLGLQSLWQHQFLKVSYCSNIYKHSIKKQTNKQTICHCCFLSQYIHKRVYVICSHICGDIHTGWMGVEN